MIKNYIKYFSKINPIYFIDFSLSEEHVKNQLLKMTEEEIMANLNYLMKNALYFKYYSIYNFLKKKAFNFVNKTGNDYILKVIEKNENLKKYTY